MVNYDNHQYHCRLLLEGDSDRFYSYLHLTCNEKISIHVLSTAGQHHVTGTSKAEALSQQFLSAFTQEDTDNMPATSHQQYNSIKDIIFTPNGITKLLQQIRPGKAAGPDELPARVLKEMACEISGMLTFLFQQSYECGSVPEDWSKATVAAIYKKGNKMEPSNHRPVSLTCILCKIMEHVVFSHMASHMEDNKILTFRQHGFRPGYSCETQLVSAFHEWASCLEDCGQTDIKLLDFSKAFDHVPHSRLMLKLKMYGINGRTGAWIEAFLGNRSQSIIVNGSHSMCQPFMSGVPKAEY